MGENMSEKQDSFILKGIESRGCELTSTYNSGVSSSKELKEKINFALV